MSLIIRKIQMKLRRDSPLYPSDRLKFKTNLTIPCVVGDEEWLEFSYATDRTEIDISTLENNSLVLTRAEQIHIH